MLKRLAVLGAVLSSLGLATGSASAGLGGPPSVSTVSFVGGAGLSNATCQYVPAGTTISWTGPETASTIVRTASSGVTTLQVVSHASGKATDNHGNTYAFDYSNAFRVSNSVGDPDTFTGTMTDSFSLAGPALHLSNGFIANLTTNLSDVFVFDPINSRGDPDRLRGRLGSLRSAVTANGRRRVMHGQRERDRPAPLRRLPSLLGRAAAVAAALLVGVMIAAPGVLFGRGDDRLDERLTTRLQEVGFSGRIESTLTQQLGRPLDQPLANIGRLLWFDTVTGLNGDNTCAGCHSPTNGFGDSQPIAIGIDNNGVVGPDRSGARNMRRAPMVINTAFFPSLMWNARFSSSSGDPFDNSAGFVFPLPEGKSLSSEPHLLVAQAFIPPTERTEVAGFAFAGDNDAIRAEVARRLNAVPAYRRLFARVFPAVREGGPITFAMFARAIAEFEFTVTFADAPIDRYARGDLSAMNTNEKRGALLFFGKAGCVSCHGVSGQSNEMFTDFKEHAIAVPQLVPRLTNNQFDGPGVNEDFGREDFTGNASDRYAFRTPSLRNVAVEAAYMHDGAFTSLADAIRHHLDARASLLDYDPKTQHLPSDLTGAVGPRTPLLAALDPLLDQPITLTASDFNDLVAFVRDALLDPRAAPSNLRKLIPPDVPSGNQTLSFEFGGRHATRMTPRH